jgi:hypothetical protein
MLALRREDRIDDDVGPEPAPIAPNAPAFLLEAALLQGDAEILGRLLLLLSFREMEPGVVRSQDLVGGKALEPLRAWVPTGDRSVPVEHVNRIVLDALDKQPIALFSRGRIGWNVQSLHGNPRDTTSLNARRRGRFPCAPLRITVSKAAVSRRQCILLHHP